MLNNDNLYNQIFSDLEGDSLPTRQQKEKMLEHILVEGEEYKPTIFEKTFHLNTEYPWKIAFGISAVQAIVFTLIFGTQYTNLFL